MGHPFISKGGPCMKQVPVISPHAESLIPQLKTFAIDHQVGLPIVPVTLDLVPPPPFLPRLWSNSRSRDKDLNMKK